MSQTTTGRSTRKYAHCAQQKSNKKTRNSNKKRAAASIKIYKRVMVKLVRLFSARPAAVSLVAIGLSLPNPL